MSNQNSTAAPAVAAPEAQPLPPDAFLGQVAFGAMMSQALYVAAKLGVADLLAAGPQTIKELAAAARAHERSLYRLLRSLSSIGIFAQTEPKVFSNTPYSEALRSDVPNSMRNGVIFMGEDWHWRVWSNMLYSVQTGKPAWERTHGAEVFKYLAQNPREAEIFNNAMTDISVNTAPAVTEAYDFSGINLLTDIAGGHGYLLAQVLKANPAMRGILFDVAPVIAGAGRLIEKEGVAERVEKVSGDFFAAVPSGADAYMMKHIIHDWDDERASRILRNINQAMAERGKVLIIEVVVPEGDEPHYSKLMDLEMLVSPGGVERTANEYRELLGAAGLQLARIIPTRSPFSIIEAVRGSAS
jgi:hypothetical protein